MSTLDEQWIKAKVKSQFKGKYLPSTQTVFVEHFISFFFTKLNIETQLISYLFTVWFLWYPLTGILLQIAVRWLSGASSLHVFQWGDSFSYLKPHKMAEIFTRLSKPKLHCCTNFASSRGRWTSVVLLLSFKDKSLDKNPSTPNSFHDIHFTH